MSSNDVIEIAYSNIFSKLVTSVVFKLDKSQDVNFIPDSNILTIPFK